MHHQWMSIEIEKQGLKRSEKGKFTCKYEKEYMITQSLKQHQRSCKIEVFIKEKRNSENDDDKDIFSYLQWFVAWEILRWMILWLYFCDI